MTEYLTKLTNLFELYFSKKAPQLPENIKESIVKYGPYVAIVIVVLTLPALLVALGLTALFSPFAYLGGVATGTSFTMLGLFLLVSLILSIAAIPGLFKRTKSSWNLMYYSTLLNLVYNLLSFNLGGLIIGGAISLYFLFQIKSYYK